MMRTDLNRAGSVACRYVINRELRQLTQNDYSRVRLEKRYQRFPYQTKQKKIHKRIVFYCNLSSAINY